MIIGKCVRNAGGGFPVFIDGKPLDPGPSQKIYNHSPDGFTWGYNGSGPAQLALAILLHFADERFARRYYQDFKSDVIARQRSLMDMRIPNEAVYRFIKAKKI